jgi:hypothetical protein
MMPGAAPIGGDLPGAPPQPQGAPGAGILDGLKSLLGAQQSPEPDGIEKALTDATMLLQFATSRLGVRSAEITKILADAVGKIQQARQRLKEMPTAPLNAPPDIGFAGAGAGAPPAPMGPF